MRGILEGPLDGAGRERCERRASMSQRVLRAPVAWLLLTFALAPVHAQVGSSSSMTDDR